MCFVFVGTRVSNAVSTATQRVDYNEGKERHNLMKVGQAQWRNTLSKRQARENTHKDTANSGTINTEQLYITSPYSRGVRQCMAAECLAQPVNQHATFIPGRRAIQLQSSFCRSVKNRHLQPLSRHEGCGLCKMDRLNY